MHILATGQRPPDWVEAGYQSYAKRFSPPFSLSCQTLRPAKRKASAVALKSEQAERILASVPKGARLVALDEGGQSLTSLALADRLKQWQIDARPCVFVIGGADGLDEQVLARADFCWSLSKLTFPHAMVRVLIAEQLYRAVAINAGHPYHRE